LAYIAAHLLTPTTEQDKEAGEGEHEHDMDGAGQQVMPRCQHRDEPEGDARSQKEPDEPGARDEGASVILPATTSAKEQE